MHDGDHQRERVRIRSGEEVRVEQLVERLTQEPEVPDSIQEGRLSVTGKSMYTKY